MISYMILFAFTPQIFRIINNEILKQRKENINVYCCIFNNISDISFIYASLFILVIVENLKVDFYHYNYSY